MSVGHLDRSTSLLKTLWDERRSDPVTKIRPPRGTRWRLFDRPDIGHSARASTGFVRRIDSLDRAPKKHRHDGRGHVYSPAWRMRGSTKDRATPSARRRLQAAPGI